AWLHQRAGLDLRRLEPETDTVAPHGRDAMAVEVFLRVIPVGPFHADLDVLVEQPGEREVCARHAIPPYRSPGLEHEAGVAREEIMAPSSADGEARAHRLRR